MPRLNVLVVGNNIETEVIYNKINNSDFINKIFLAEENPSHKEHISYNNYDELAQKALEKEIELVIATSEKDICNGIVDILSSYGLECIGTNRKYSRLASSKIFAKKFMDKYNIPHPKTISEEDLEYPFLIKHDDKYNSNRPKIIFNEDDKQKYIKEFNENYFFEEYIEGEELSVTSYFDGENLTNFEPVKVHRTNFSFSSSSCPIFLSYEKYDKLQNYLTKLEHALLEDDANFKGFITSNLIWNNNEWFVIDFETSTGEKQTQTLLQHLESDFLSTLLYGTRQKYREKTSATLAIDSKIKDLDSIQNIIDLPSEIKTYPYNINAKRKMFTLSTTADFPLKILQEYADKVIKQKDNHN